MAHGNKYKIVFKNRQEDMVTVYIMEKDYSGGVVELEGGGDPLTIEYQSGDDNIIAPIRASIAKIRYWNKGAYPLTTFASDDDDKFKIEVYVNSNFGNSLYWTGYIVQDDCREDFMPPDNLVELTATDNLGLLKSVAFDEVYGFNWEEIFTGDMIEVGMVSPNILGWKDGATPTPTILPGDRIRYTNTPFDQLFTNVSYVGQHDFGPPTGRVTNVTVAEFVSSASSPTGTITIYRKNTTTLYEKLPLTQYFQLALGQTGLELDTDIYCNVFENGMDDRSVDPANEPFSQTKVSTKTFLKSATEWDDIYTVLEKILAAWKCTLFQAEGRWNIIRWPELKEFANAIPGTRYNSSFASPGAVTLNATRQIGKDLPIYPINANAIQTIVRPNKYSKLQFNYEQPFQIAANYDFQTLGDLITSYADGSNMVYEYEMKFWDQGFTYTSGGGGLLMSDLSRFIRVIKDSTGTEIERYGVIKGHTAVDQPAGATMQPIEVNAGDVISLSFSYRTNKSQGGVVTNIFDFDLVTALPLTPRNSNNRYLEEGGTWTVPRAFSYQVPSGDNTNEWHNVSVTSVRIPFDGYLYLKIGQACISATSIDETHYKDWQITYTPYINETTQIIGHIHKSVQNSSIKKNYEETIFIDDSPRSNLRGVMFLDNGTTKTSSWNRGVGSGALKFGFIQGSDLLFITDSFRKRIEGDFKGLKDNSSYLFSLLNVFQFDSISGSSFILGQCSIDLNKCVITGVLEEIWNDAEVYDSGLYENSFTYIYRTE